MIKQISFLLILISFVGYSQQVDNSGLWIQDFEKAKQLAKEEKKSILMYFTGSDWCGPCRLLKADFFDTEKFKQFKKSYVFVKVDIPRNQDILSQDQLKKNFDLLKQYNKERSFPLLIVMSSKGKELDQVSGYSSLRDPKYHYQLLNKFAK